MITVNKSDVNIQGDGLELMSELTTGIIGFYEVVGEDEVKTSIASALAILCGYITDNDSDYRKEIADFIKHLDFNFADELKGIVKQPEQTS